MATAVLSNIRVILILNQRELPERFHNIALKPEAEQIELVTELAAKGVFPYIRLRENFDNKEAMKLAKDAGYDTLMMECVG